MRIGVGARFVSGETCAATPMATDEARSPATGTAVGHLNGPVSRERCILQGALAVLGAAAKTIDDAVRSAAELVSNAVRHAQGSVELRLSVCGGSAVIAVVDSNPDMPLWPAGPPDHGLRDDGALDLDTLIDAVSTTGQGLSLVRQLSGGACGAASVETSDGTGKAVWFAQTLPVTSAGSVAAQDNPLQGRHGGADDPRKQSPRRRAFHRRGAHDDATTAAQRGPQHIRSGQ